MSKTKLPTEGGSGGKRGHSGMEHWDKTEDIKKATRQKRRAEDKAQSSKEAHDYMQDKEK